MSSHPAYDLTAVRAHFPIAQTLTYLNHASISPIPLATQQAMNAMTEILITDPMASFMVPPPKDIFTRFHSEIMTFINAAGLHEIVGVSSTSAGLNAVAQGIDWKAGDNIVFVDVEFPSNVYPWMALERRGVQCKLVPAVDGGISAEVLDRVVDGHTRLIAVSAVQFLTGHRADLAAIGAYCRERNILFAVDAIQAAGHMPIDVQAMNIDILCAGGQKSLMGPPGQGFLYVREAAADTMIPGTIGPNGVEGWEHWLKYDLTPRQGALRFMMGTPDVVGMAGLIASIQFLRGLGLENIDSWTCHLSQIAMDDLTARGYDVITPRTHVGPIVTFRLSDEARATELLKRLIDNNIRVTKHWDANKVPHLRISTHCYNTEDEIRRVGLILGDNLS